MACILSESGTVTEENVQCILAALSNHALCDPVGKKARHFGTAWREFFGVTLFEPLGLHGYSGWFGPHLLEVVQSEASQLIY
jgi:hypothetical protein